MIKSNETKPLLLNEFSFLMTKMGNFEDNPRIGVSLSGGCDSFALFNLLNDWLKNRGGRLVALIVDHGLRVDSSSEAKEIKKLVQKKKVKCKILSWNGKKPVTRIMETARNYRYKLLIKECIKEKILHLFFGHHLNDNIETFLMREKRLGHKSGLSSIQNIREEKNVRILRPLLEIEKKRLVGTCSYYNQKWFEDPSNDDRKFERVRIRQDYQIKKNQLKIKKKIDFYVKQKQNLEKKISLFFANHLFFESFGVFKIKKNEFEKLENTIQIIILKKILTTNSGLIYPPRYKSIETALKKMKCKDFTKQTLHGNYISVKKEMVVITKELGKKNKETKKKIILKPNILYSWDKRFLLSAQCNGISCYPINSINLQKISALFFKKNKRKIPFNVLQTLPLIKKKKKYFIPFVTSNEKLKENGISFFFNPPVPLTNN